MKSVSVVVLVLVLLAPVAVQAQQPAKAARIGVLSSLTADAPRAQALREGLRQYGYVEGRNIAIEWRPSSGRAERFAELAADLVHRKVDIIVASDNPAIAAALGATKSIPIVMITATDPVGTGFISSLARPGGNITGLTFQAPEVQGKSLQLLKEALPRATRMAALWNPSEPGRRAPASEAESAARALGLHFQLVGVSSAGELATAFRRMAQQRCDAVIVQASQLTFAQRNEIAELAAANGIATMGWSGDVVEAGMLMSYGASIPELYRRAGYYVDRILKGAKAGELPVEQPTKFELTINLKTAKRLGITLPKAVVARADRTIE